MSGQSPFPGSALHRPPHRATTEHARPPLSGLASYLKLTLQPLRQPIDVILALLAHFSAALGVDVGRLEIIEHDLLGGN